MMNNLEILKTHLCDITAGWFRAECSSKYGVCSVLLKTFAGFSNLKIRFYLMSGGKNMVGEVALSEEFGGGV